MESNNNSNALFNNYRKIIDKLRLFSNGDSNILVCSAKAKDGRTMTSIGLAFTAALLNPNRSILLADLDARNPNLHRIFALDNSIGMTDIINGESSMSDAVNNTPLKNLKVMPVGNKMVDFSEARQPRNLIKVLNHIKSHYDLAFYDSPPIEDYTDAVILSNLMDGVLLVVRSNSSKREEVVAVKNALDYAGGKVIGAVLSAFRSPVPSFLDKRV
jgi:capsular exopolysaccharide synthesis family protein